MAIKVGSSTVIDNNRRADFSILNMASYTRTQLQNLSVTGDRSGDMVYNSTDNTLALWNGSLWIIDDEPGGGGAGGGGATGGGEYSNGINYGQYRYHVFTEPGTFTFTRQVDGADLLVVGGGGGAGAADGGGGGGGGGNVIWKQLSSSDISKLVGKSQTVTVGVGGAGGAVGTPSKDGTNGGPSTFGSIIANGGGGGSGGGPRNSGRQGSPGGSGGGGGGGTDAAAPGGLGIAENKTSSDGITYTTQGNRGGNGDVSGINPLNRPFMGGGGGGAGGPGGNANRQNDKGGYGGQGVSIPDFIPIVGAIRTDQRFEDSGGIIPNVFPNFRPSNDLVADYDRWFGGGGSGMSRQWPPDSEQGTGPNGRPTNLTFTGGGGVGMGDKKSHTNQELAVQYQLTIGIATSGGGGGGTTENSDSRYGAGGPGCVVVRYLIY